MNLEREDSNTKWYRNNGFRRKQRNLGIRSKIWITLDRYNNCRTRMMFDFIEQAKDKFNIRYLYQKGE